jgi:CheY-like chemotaxis protein
MDKQKKEGIRVALLVDDDLSFLDKVQRTLRESFTVHTATSGVEAIQKIRSLSSLDALVVSEELPRMKGTELLRIIHEMDLTTDSVIRILITECATNGTVIDLARHGHIDSCIAKPVDPEAIRRKLNYLFAKKSREKRTSMRVTLSDPGDVRIETGDAGEAKVINLSENGMFLKTLSFFPEGSSVPLRIVLPDGRQYAASGRIVRQDLEQGGIGVEFESIDDESRISILQFLSEYVTLRDLSSLKLRYPFLRTEEMVLFSDSLKIEELLREAHEMGVEVVALHAHSRASENLEFKVIEPPFSCVLTGKDLNVRFKTSDLLFISFQIGYATYNFETMISRISPDGESLVCLYPSLMFYSEKRTEKRISPKGSLRVEIPLPPPFKGKVSGRVTDISPGGVSFITDGDAPVLLKGTPLDRLRILDGDELIWEENGEIRYVAAAADGLHERRKFGIQFGISRMSIQTVQMPAADSFRISGQAPHLPAQPRLRKAAVPTGCSRRSSASRTPRARRSSGS